MTPPEILTEQLTAFYAPEGIERVGLVLKDGTIVELKNVDPEPENAFMADPEAMCLYEEDAVATFHTHPGSNKNLSGKDFLSFLNWFDVRHFIIGKDGVACYISDGNNVFLSDEATDNSPRQTS